jgi:DNA-directed RNA polymerase subunit RPC12/RpoP
MELAEPLPDRFLYRCQQCGKEAPTDAVPRHELGPVPVRCPRCGA